MKRKLLIFMSVLVLSGCTLLSTGTSPKRVVEDFFGKYQSLNQKVLDQLGDVIEKEKLTDTQSADYNSLMRKQYQNLTYTIKNEVIDGDNAIETVEIEVYDYGKAIAKAQDYAADNESKFLDENGKYSDTLYEDYKIEQMKAVTDRVKYTLDLELSKDNNEWKLDDLSDMERQKIHGLYNE